MNYFYILQSEIDNTFYYGHTNDLKKRINDHNKGKTKSIKCKIPYKLIYYEAYYNKRLARKRELHIKKSGKVRRLLLKRLGCE